MKNRQRYYYLIQLQYLGYRYHGWMKQPNIKTVQGMVDRTIRFILQHDDFKTLGASRTDAMVSANNGAFELFVWEKLEEETLFKNLNDNLPQDIRVLSVKEVDEKFNIIQNPKNKEYIYLFYYGERSHPFCSPFMAYIREDLDIDLMKEGAKLFEGKQNFQRYCVKPSADTVFEREIAYCAITENDKYTANFFPEKSYIVHVHGKGFLRHQVRFMVGTLFMLGKREITLDDIRESLKGGDNIHLGYNAPASGLHLDKLEFSV